MRVLRIVVVALAALFVIERQVRERARLRRVQRLGGTEGLRHLEARDVRGERTFLLLTLGLAAAAAASLIHLALVR